MSFFDSVFADQDRERRERSVHGIAIAKVAGRMADGTYELRYLGMGGDAPSAPARMMMPNAGSKRGATSLSAAFAGVSSPAKGSQTAATVTTTCSFQP